MRSTTHFDIIIIGLGSMGSSAAYYASLSGKKVLALDQFNPPHFKGSHSGGSRIIRKAYFEHPDYVPLLELSYKNWFELEQTTQQTHFHKTGLIYFGKEQDMLLSGVQNSAQAYDITIEEFSKDAVKKSYPQFKPTDNFSTLLEPEAGFIDTDSTIRSYQTLAMQNGAELLTDTKVQSWELSNAHVHMHTDMGIFTADKLIMSAGAWTAPLLKNKINNLKLKTTRQSFFYFEPTDNTRYIESVFPCWNIQDPNYEGLFYGFPYKPKTNAYGEYGLKMAHHHPAEAVRPDTLLDPPSPQELEDVRNILDTYIPGATAQLISSGTCIYTNSEDEDFIIDFLEGTDNRVILATGFSGHGFKFVPAIGQLLAQMATENIKAKELDFLSADRFSSS